MIPGDKGEGRLARFSLDRRITVLVLFLSTLVVGTVAALRIPIELFPGGYSPPSLMVQVPWQNAPSRDVLDKITLPLEEELSTVAGLDSIVTISQVGAGLAILGFKQGTNMDVGYREVRDRIERAKNRFPAEIDRVFLRKDDPSGLPVYLLILAVDPELLDSYNLIQSRIIKPLQRVDGVASVEIHGLVEKEILIELDREKTGAAGLNIFALAQDLSQDNFTLASGTVRDGPSKLLLRSMARFGSLAALENRFVGPAVRLKDVGAVSYREPDRNFRVRAMSRPAVAVLVYKEGQANILQVSTEVDRAVERFKHDPRLTSLALFTLFSQGEVIVEALSTLLNSGVIGGVIAALVLFFFLGRVRLTLILALAIPLSIVIGLIVMFFAGESLNLLTLLGLMICVGMLVDNSIVVAENIHRMYRDGVERREACIQGASEVALAITMSTLTTLVVFLPVALVQGPGQFFLLRLAIPVCVSVGASLVVALLFIPLCVYATLRSRVDDEVPARGDRVQALRRRGDALLRAAYDSSLEALNRAYGRMLAVFLVRRLDLVLAILVTFVLTFFLCIKSGAVSFVDVQDEERQGFLIGVEMPRTSTLEETEQWFLAAEQAIGSKKEELGLEGWFLFHQKTRGELQGWFSRPRTTSLSPTEATEIVKDALPRAPGVQLTIGKQNEGQDAKDDSSYAIVINGEEPETLDAVKRDLEGVFARVEGVLGVQGGNDPPPNELGVVIDRVRAERYAVNPQHVAGVVGTALMGMQLPKYHEHGKEIPVRVRFREEDRESMAELADFQVATGRGELLPLSSVTDAEILPTPETIVRRNKRMARTITLLLEQGDEQATRSRLATLQKGIDLPEGAFFGDDVQAQSLNEELLTLLWALGLSITFIYLLMGFLFESFMLPLSIVLTIPLSIIGVYWTHLLFGRDIDFLGVVAVILLVGVVVNNGIVLIDYVHRLRSGGHGRSEALLMATSRRFRPIMMTALTTIMGLIPLVFAGSNSIGLSYTSFSLTLIGGMTTATMLTLLVVPVSYTLFDDLGASLGQMIRRFVRPEESPGSAGILRQPITPGATLPEE